ncbi:MAG: ABC transporter ATP-binding protein [Nitrospina sp.]|nr:ABC transporter ATP-binding protein [Nitrospina sp.]MBT3416089.1 ABC transporter ATP-binding protein [Nitrospina sp.]MBT3856079.1 ABC transporter ATP-binding protein [Nitrospina sp.]MBT4104408.1 ABC transporter ATP-binding protein [Nitrospina sp.]MBT4389923.1 ABC transporter ATP-binding protein [Nitrospina sp.]
MVRLDSISKSFGGKPVVENVSLEIEAGERFTLLGRSGCGKTTLLRMIAGFETPDSGTIAIAGQDVGSLPVEQRPVGLIFQNYALFPHMSVYDNIAVGPRIRKHPEIDIAKNIDELLEITHLQALRDAHPGQISGGEAQRVALARAVINRPKILLLDEPLSALDLSLRQHLREELVEMQKMLGITFLFVTHDQEEAMGLATRMGIMDNGCLQQVGTPAELYEKPQTAFIAEFLGEVNRLTGNVEQRTGNQVTVSLGPAGNIQCVAEISERKNQTCYVRPEKLFFDPDRPQTEPTNSLQGTLRAIHFFGSHTRYQVQLADGQSLTISSQQRKTRSPQYSIGDTVQVLFAVADVFTTRRGANQRDAGLNE